MNFKLNEIKDKVINEEDAQVNAKELKENWNEVYEKLTYYLEHDELEKVATKLTDIEANIEMDENAECVMNVEECKYILAHIEEKQSFKIQNIF